MHMVYLVCMITYLATRPVQSQIANNDDYGIILDGGSSGTKLKIYKWNLGSQKKTEDNAGVIKYNLHLIKNKKYLPSVNDIAYALSKVHDYIVDMLNHAKDVVPRDKHGTTAVYFMATAGLRTLPVSTTHDLLDAIESTLGNTTVCPFVTRDNSVRVISGEEEAVFAWLAVNYLRGFFWSSRSPSNAVGVLEMGGGSTQIAFLPDHSIYANMYPVRIGGSIYHLYAHSYLFYGQNYIASRINSYLIELSNDRPFVENPCMLRDDNIVVNSVHIHGSGNVTKCLEIIDIFLKSEEDEWCHPKPCAIGRTYQPSVESIVFYAISAFIYAPKYLKAVDELGRLNITLLKDNAIKYCQKKLFETGNEPEYASSYCIMGLYIPALLLDAYNFREDRNTVYLKTAINKVEIDWSLGAMLLFTETELDERCVVSCSLNVCSSAIGLLVILWALI